MIHTIRVIPKNSADDGVGKSLLSEISSHFNSIKISDVKTAKIYRVEGVTKNEAQRLQEILFHEAINQTSTIDSPILNNTKNIIEIGYKPGVMNPEVASIIKAAKDLGINLNAADTSREIAFYGAVSKEQIVDILKKLNVFNPTIEHVVTKEPTTLLIKGVVGKTTTVPIHGMSDVELMQLSKDKLFLNLEEMKVIQKYFQKIKRDPTDCEVETLAQTWSEHSGHKTFKALLTVDGKKKEPLIKRIKKEALKHKKHIVSAFVDNAGVMDFYDGFAILGKGETHNSPSAIEPYGGAMTGSGGVFRDIVGTGLGAKTVVSTDIFCLGPWDLPNGQLPAGCLPPSYILKRVIAAVRDYGNRMGIPTNNGSLHFHKDFRAKPTVLVGAYGIMPKMYAQKGTPKKGDIIVSIGGRVGRDGIHGATFSSGEMTEKTISVNAQAVQIGNAIEEKRMFDAIIEARDAHLIRASQDSGGGGLSSAVGEMGSEIGVKVQLKNERLKYQGLSPWEIWLSESQERMILAIPKNKFIRFKKICKKYNVEVTNLGFFDGSKKLQVYYGTTRVADLDMDFLHNGLPQRRMIAKRPTNLPRPVHEKIKMPKNEKEWVSILKKVLSHGNICSKEPIIRMYDHSVQGTNDLQPYSGVQNDGPNDAVVIRPILNKKYGMVVSHGLNPILNKIDPYWGSIWAATEAIANYTAVGGDYREASLINNYVWPFPDEESLWSLDKSVDAVVDIMHTFKIPVISGKDSLSSTYRGKDGTVIKIPPVLCMSVFGRIKDATKTITSDFKKENSIIVLLGKLDEKNLGGSVYYDVHNMVGTDIPKINLSLLPKTLATLISAIQKGAILSCHDISEGGLITSIFEMCVGGDMGAQLTLNRESPDHFLFNETAGTFVLEVKDKQTAQELFKKIPHQILGKTQTRKTIDVSTKRKRLFSADLQKLKDVWKKPMEEIFP